MMKKLLHERLRKAISEANRCCSYEVGVCVEGDYIVLDITDAKGVVNEIERDYIPRSEHDAEMKRIVEAQGNGSPHMPSAHHVIKVYAEKNGMPMEDGESITKWLDRWFVKLPCDDKGVPWKVSDHIVFPNEGEVRIDFFSYEDGEMLPGAYVGCDKIHYSAEDCKRPTPKVLDADGVETKVGDIVYNVRTGAEVTVAEIFVCGALRWKSCSGGSGTWLPESVTHEKPVFDANGERIKAGDTVWSTLNSVKGEVKHIRKNAPADDYIVLVEFEDGTEGHQRGEDLTHRAPDSLQKLRDDMNYCRIGGTYPGTAHEFLCKCADRLTALIERGA